MQIDYIAVHPHTNYGVNGEAMPRFLANRNDLDAFSNDAKSQVNHSIDRGFVTLSLPEWLADG